MNPYQYDKKMRILQNELENLKRKQSDNFKRLSENSNENYFLRDVVTEYTNSSKQIDHDNTKKIFVIKQLIDYIHDNINSNNLDESTIDAAKIELKKLNNDLDKIQRQRQNMNE